MDDVYVNTAVKIPSGLFDLSTHNEVYAAFSLMISFVITGIIVTGGYFLSTFSFLILSFPF